MSGLGKQLVKDKWRQGSLLPPLPALFHFSIDRPLTTAARLARADARQEYQERVEVGERPEPVGQAIATLCEDEVLCVISQTCDIAADEEEEPFVEVMPAYREPDEQARNNADRNSTRRFLLSPERELLIDATRRFSVEKAILSDYAPDNPALGEDRERRLRRFLARRGGRPALHDDVVRYVIRPIQKGLADRKRHRRALGPMRSLRVEHLNGPPPYAVRLIALLAREPTAEEDDALDEFAAAVDKWLPGGQAHLEEWSVMLEDEIKLGDYRATDEVYLDQYTYRGEDVVGVEPSWED